jgi:hypothetical protein
MAVFRLPLSVAAILFVTSCHTNPSLGVKIDSRLGSYVPRDSALLAGVNVHDLVAAPFYGRHAADLKTSLLNAVSANTGIDPTRDISSALFPFRNGPPLVLARGGFDARQIEARLHTEGAVRTQVGHQVVVQNGSAIVAFPEKGVAIAGPVQLMHSYLADGSRGIPDSLLARARSLPSTDQIWIVSREGLPVNALPLSADMKSMIGNLSGYLVGFDGGVEFDSGAHLQANLQCDSPDGARQVYGALRAGIGLARLTTRDKDLPLLQLYDAVHISLHQYTVTVRADLSAALADQLYNLLPKRSS